MQYLSKPVLLKGVLAGLFITVLPWLMVWVNTAWVRIFPIEAVSACLWIVNGLSLFLSESFQLSERVAIAVTFTQWVIIATTAFALIQRARVKVKK